ncbi:UDP-N-acetylmuramate--L-alanine ligase [Candidatus Woesebacteria bacterium]|nr:UDP-N-acetylmuramate--L-alanine ligase [Candidatus Woesebacteria bacterium]
MNTVSIQNVLEWDRFFLVGVKGVAMTALAACLIDMGKTVRGGDTAEDFITKDQLEELGITATSLDTPLPENTQCVIYTAAHNGPDNPLVREAQAKNTPTLSHAEALGLLFNQKKGIAVCGVGGKSTVSAMIAWILEHTARHPSYAVGVGSIPGLSRTGAWNQASEYFVAEADEYVTDPAAVTKGEQVTPRFSYLKPYLTVCTNLAFDHPDVYQDFNHTKEVFAQFFSHIKPGGILVYNADDRPHLPETLPAKGISFGTKKSGADVIYALDPDSTRAGTTAYAITHQGATHTSTLALPGLHNVANAASALAATTHLGIALPEAMQALTAFRSTKRRFEYIRERDGVTYYDDYAHHPDEITATLTALGQWYPDQKKIVVFQPHTYSRTKELFDDFVDALAKIERLILLEVFASAREERDDSVSSQLLAEAVKQKNPAADIAVVTTLDELAKTLNSTLRPGDACLTMGAGDVYKVYDIL